MNIRMIMGERERKREMIMMEEFRWGA